MYREVWYCDICGDNLIDKSTNLNMRSALQQDIDLDEYVWEIPTKVRDVKRQIIVCKICAYKLLPLWADYSDPKSPEATSRPSD